MGYTTDFFGRFELNKPLSDELYEYLVKFNETRRMARKVDEKYGTEGEFYVEGNGDYGQDHEDNIIEYNQPPSTQPGLWCQWCPSDDKQAIEWDGGEKFYDYTEWLTYIVNNFLKPNDYVLNGQVKWQGEDNEDVGYLIVIDNEVKACEGEVIMKDTEQCKCEEYKELINELVLWRDSEEVEKTFDMQAVNSSIRSYMATDVSKEFSENAQEIWDQARAIVNED